MTEYDKCDEGSAGYSPEFAAAWEQASDRAAHPCARAALEYLRHGISVIPLKAGRKEPATIHGLSDWTDNPAQVPAWWRGDEGFNVGGVLGQVSRGIFAIDLDVHDGSGNGLDFLRDWETTHGALPETWEQETGSGGRQLFYRAEREVRNSANGELGVDIRGDGGYVVLPPSIHPNGEAYEWLCSPDDMDVADADDNVWAFVDYVRRNGGTDSATTKENGKFRLPDRIKKGQRDDTLYKYACHLRAIGRSDEEMLVAVMGANMLRCEVPLDSRDIERIVRSAARFERGESNSSDEKAIGRPGAPAHPSPQGGGGSRKNVTSALGRKMIDDNHARLIDGAPAVWTGQRWEFGTKAIKRLALRYDDSLKAQDKNEVVSYVIDMAPSIESDREFDGKPYIQFANGTWDVLGNAFVNPTPEMYITGTLPVELHPDRESNLADEFLASVSAGDPGVRRVLEEVIGACMCSSRLISQSPMLVGRAGGAAGAASNGKSTYINALRMVLGSSNVSSLDISTLGQRFQAGRVVGKLANLGDDIPDGFLKGEELSTFKKLVTGDSIYTDVKGVDGFEFRPSATMVFSMNSIPRLSDTTDGVFRRLAFVPFKRHFSPDDPDFDPYMARRLSQPEVMERLALLGTIRAEPLYESGHLTRIPEMDEEVNEVRAMNDTVLLWMVSEELGIEAFANHPTSQCYRDYKEWCDENGERNPVSGKVFTQRVKMRFPELTSGVKKFNVIGNKRAFMYAK